MAINQFFDKVYVLNLHRRSDRLLLTDKRMKFCDIEYDTFHAVDGTVMKRLWEVYSKETSYFSNPSYLGTAVSHLAIYKDAISNGYKKILILEDDNRIHRNANQLFALNISTLPDDWELLYLGFIPLSDDCTMWNYNVLADRFVTPKMFRAKNCWGLYAYGITDKLMKEILAVYDEKFPMELDRYFTSTIQPRDKSYGFVPQLFAADDGYSDNSGRVENSMLTRSIDARFATHTDYV